METLVWRHIQDRSGREYVSQLWPVDLPLDMVIYTFTLDQLAAVASRK